MSLIKWTERGSKSGNTDSINPCVFPSDNWDPKRLALKDHIIYGEKVIASCLDVSQTDLVHGLPRVGHS